MDSASSSSNTTVSYIVPSTQTPLFVAEWVTCAYPVSDLYASAPRYLYYGLLGLVFLTQWHPWLANVFLGVVATYAGTAAIEAFILISNQPYIANSETVSIPYISPGSVPGNATLSQIPNLIDNNTYVDVQPAALEYDIDALLAITVTGYLMMLPMHCWSSAVRKNRARHFLIFLWNIIMFAGMICSILLWPTLFDSPLQYRFCYPTLLDSNSTTSDGHYSKSLWKGDWNATIWNTFEDFSIAADLNDNCLYPCFNTSQILRRPASLVAAITPNGKNPRTNAALAWANLTVSETTLDKESNLANLMYAALITTTVVMVVLLVFLLSPARDYTRVPVQKPKELLWSARKEIYHVLWSEFKQGIRRIITLLRSPKATAMRLRALSRPVLHDRLWYSLRWFVDILALLTLFFAMILTPATIVVFIVWIEWYIHRDLVSSEAVQQVGQWGSLVSVALVLVSAVVLRLRYLLATKREVQDEIAETQKHLIELELLLEVKIRKEDGQRRRSQTEMGQV